MQVQSKLKGQLCGYLIRFAIGSMSSVQDQYNREFLPFLSVMLIIFLRGWSGWSVGVDVDEDIGVREYSYVMVIQ